MSSVQSTGIFAQANFNLKEMGVRYMIRATKQTPFAMIVARESFEDGSKTRTTAIRWDSAGAMKRLYQLCLDLNDAERPLALLEHKKEAPTDAFTAWTALVANLQAHLERKGIQWHDQDYARHMKQLGQLTGPVKPQKLQKWIETCPTDSRDYERRLITLKKILKCCPTIQMSDAWLEKAHDENNYSPDQSINPRSLPTEHQVELFIDSIPTPTWRRYFGLCAVYGLRTHEPFTLIAWPDADGLIEVNSKKTGYRFCYPRKKAWIDRWDLRNTDLPKANPEHTGKQLGNRASTQWQRYRQDMPKSFLWRRDAQCYDLRHAFAAAYHTTSDCDHMAFEALCLSMGHSPKIHTKHYKRWIEKKSLKEQAARRFNNR